MRHSLARCILAAVFVGWMSTLLSASPPRTAIIGAMPEETSLLRKAMADVTTEKIQGIAFHSGTLEGRPVVVCTSGVGKVNAALVTTLLIAHFSPSEVIFTGIAGGLNEKLEPGDIVIAARTAQHDLCEVVGGKATPIQVKNPVDNKRNPAFFPADPRLLRLAQDACRRIAFAPIPTTQGDRVPAVVTGVVVTGDMFVACEVKNRELREKFAADATEMEGAAVAQVCYELKVPALVIRSLSDRADRSASRDMRQFITVACTNAATLTREMVRQLAKDATSRPE